MPEFKYFTVFLKNRNIISKMKRSKVTDYAALSYHLSLSSLFCLFLSGRFTCFTVHSPKMLILIRLNKQSELCPHCLLQRHF